MCVQSASLCVFDKHSLLTWQLIVHVMSTINRVSSRWRQMSGNDRVELVKVQYIYLRAVYGGGICKSRIELVYPISSFAFLAVYLFFKVLKGNSPLRRSIHASFEKNRANQRVQAIVVRIRDSFSRIIVSHPRSTSWTRRLRLHLASPS